MRNLTEFNKLEQYCKDNGLIYTRYDRDDGPIPFLTESFDRHMICVYKSEKDKADDRRWFDAICQYGSYGASDGLLEIMGEIVMNDCDEVEGWLTADEIISRL